MKITKPQLKQIIKEELGRVLKEGIMDWMKSLGKEKPAEESSDSSYDLNSILGIPQGGPLPTDDDRFDTEQEWINYATNHNSPISREKAQDVWAWRQARWEEIENENDVTYHKRQARKEREVQYSYLDDDWKTGGSKGPQPSKVAADEYDDNQVYKKSRMRRRR